MKIPNPTQPQRRRIYEAAIALLAVGVVYGLITNEQALALGAVLIPVLGLARANAT